MNHVLMIAIIALAVFALRLSGFLAHRVGLPAPLEQALRFTPVAVLGAIVASSLAEQGQSEPLRLVAAAIATGVMLLTGRMWLCIGGGLLSYWLLKLSLG